jgi:SecDF, P1 head subdomain
MRVLAASLAAATAPIFGLWNLQTDLSHASRNTYGDIAVKPRAVVAGKGTLVRCGTWCRFGSGWLAFAKPARLATADVADASARFSRRDGWVVQLTLRPAAQARWASFSRSVNAQARRNGVPAVLVVAVDGQIAAAPFSSQVAAKGGVVTLTGFAEAGAKKLASLLR